MSARYDAWLKENPWYNSLRAARERCGRPAHKMFYRYGGRGIRCLLTPAEVKMIWERDGGADMDRPTLDRHPDNDGNYELGNVRFLPKRLNYSAPSKRDCARGEQN